MIEFDVNSLLFSFEPEMAKTEAQVFQWLNENIGPTILHDRKVSLQDPEPYSGHGWRIVSRKTHFAGGPTRQGVDVIGWYLQIDHNEKATMFALKWVK